ncbi:MAG: FKBP-type peptidyl-prolyl cis-trans isomerase [Jatrophihabitans sp.]|uniref:FKBP-type peptidyl-prolyl cis-trans isomerase n=1 Tax=Jatrophihabitans sp. TaxID=1932789 RepID=UPI003F810215
MPTQKQQREAARRHLERQLKARQERAARRKRMTLITSIIGTLVVIALVIVLVVTTTGNDSKKDTAAGSGIGRSSSPGTSSAAPAPSSSGTACDNSNPTKVTVHRAKGAKVTFDGVTVEGAADLTGKPVVTASNKTQATKLAVKDLVVGTGKAAGPTSCVTIQYDGVLFTDGKEFDSSWNRGETAQFPLTGVVPGFTQGIGGTTGVAPMKEGGRRIIIVPAALGYGSQASGSIPANSSLVFVVDLKSVDG